MPQRRLPDRTLPLFYNLLLRNLGQGKLADWDNAPAIPSSDNVNGNDKIRQNKSAVARLGTKDRPCFDPHFTADPVLLAPLTSFRTKHDINEEIDTSSTTLKLGRNKGLVFHRNTVTDQVSVTRKALAYAEVIITNNCRNAAAKQSVSERRGNSVMAYLDTLSRRNVMQLQKDTSVDNMEDTRRSMAVYRDGDDFQDRIRESSFTADGNHLQPK
jgi:hypothetical protein